MKPKDGDVVRVHYRGTLADGSEFDTSAGRDPLEFTLGTGEVIPGFDNAIAELEVGGSATVTIPASQAYGQRFEEAVEEIPRSAFEGDEPQVGWMVELRAPDGNRMSATVVDVAEENVTLDFNHPLAGEDLTFDLELVEIVEG
ncbi:MAG: peptidylprolyl isomerase [Coriobacteriia bacterium]|nr:peptidylprolyl isomerase [Coriobacteriia bacterium]